MTRQFWREAGPSLVVGVGILLATFIAVRTAQSGWLVLAGPLFLSLTVLGADVLASRLRGGSSRPSGAALILAATFLVASWIVALRDPQLVRLLVPTIGATAWGPLAWRSECRRRTLQGARP